MNAESNRVRVGFIVGPTGIGKSALALEVAEQVGAEIVNADSRQLYRGMDIGTAKPSCEERRRVAHHLIDVCAPDQPLDVARFRQLAENSIAEIAGRGRPILVTGGSGLYLRVLRGGIFSGPPADPALRRELHALAAEHGSEYLHQRLREVDPASAARLAPRDTYRIVRALEVYRLSGVPISAHQSRHRFADREYSCMVVGLTMARERLYAAIDRRFVEMVEAGLVEEVRALLKAGYRPDAHPLCTIGYKQIAAYLAGESSLAAAIEVGQRESRRLAKRQLTWFRRDPEIVWVEAESGRAQALKLFADFFFNRAVACGG